MATTAGEFIEISVATSLPGTPPAFFADQGPDGWEVTYRADGGTLTLTASPSNPGVLYGWVSAENRWRILEESWRTATRTVPDGQEQGDRIPNGGAVPGIGALAVVYNSITDAGTAVYQARTIRSVLG